MVHKTQLMVFFSIETYVMGTQKNRLHVTVLLGTQNKCKHWLEKKIQFHAQAFYLNIWVKTENKYLIVIPQLNSPDYTKNGQKH